MADGLWGRVRRIGRKIKIHVLEHLDSVALVVLTALIVIVFVVEWFDLNPSYNLTIYTAFLAILVTAMTKNISYLYKKLAEDNRRHTNEISLLSKAIEAGTSLLTFEGVVADIKRRLPGMAGDEVEIDHLGITLERAWDHVEPMLQHLCSVPGIRRIRYRVVMLHRVKGRPDPPWIKAWIDMAEAKRPEVESALSLLGQDCAIFDGKIRFYCEAPTLHGLFIKSPVKIAYLTLPRWTPDGTRLKPGLQHYHRIAYPEVPSQGDLLAVLQGYFQYLWRDGQKVAGTRPPIVKRNKTATAAGGATEIAAANSRPAARGGTPTTSGAR